MDTTPPSNHPPAAPKAPARRYHQIDGKFQMLRGQLDSPTLAYEQWGELNADRSNAVLIFTGLSPSAHAASSPQDPTTGWWEDMLGPDKPIDTTRYFVVCVNSLGSCFGSTGPASNNPTTDTAYRLTFPMLSVEDIANTGALLLDHLNIDRLHSVVGASMGGMTALAFAMLHPQRADGLISISSAARSMPFSIALRSLQRELVRSDDIWQKGEYDHSTPPDSGMRLARKLGMITYRSSAEWSERFGRERATSEIDPGHPFGIDFEVESYLDAQAMKFTGAFDANCYLYLSRAMDLFDAADHGGSVAKGLSMVKAKRALVIGVVSDFLFPVCQQQELAEGLEAHDIDVTYAELGSIQGHDSFLVDMDRFRPVVAEYFL